jgi:hypothetical protein
MKESKFRIVCPSCKAEYQLTQWGIFKLMRRPRCERCGTSLLEALKDHMQPGVPKEVSSGKMTCARCRQEQETAPACKWCGTPMTQRAEPGRPGQPTRPKIPWLRTVAGGVIFLALLIVPMIQDLQLPQAHRVSRQFVMENEGVQAVLGGRLDWGPVPFFFWKETRGPQEVWVGSFYFLAKGPNATTVVVVQLQKPGKSPGEWQVTEGSFYLDEDGNRNPIPRGRTPGKPKPAGKK